MKCVDLFETHRADLYHFTTMDGLKGILRSNELRKGRQRGDFISMSRNAHWWGWRSEQCVRLTFDGASIYNLVAKQGLRIQPFEEPRFASLNKPYGHRANIGEREERIFGDKLTNIIPILKIIDVKRDSEIYKRIEEQHDITNVAILAHLQKSYRIPINYEGFPLAAYAKKELEYFFNHPDADKWSFIYGEFSGTPIEKGPSVKAVVADIFSTLRI